VVAASAALVSVGGGMGLTAAHSSNQTIPTSTAKVSQPALSSRLDTVSAPLSGLKLIGPNAVVDGGGGGDTYSVIEITPFEEQTLLVSGATGVAAMTVMGCTTWWSGVGAAACVGGIAAAGAAIGALILHGQFPYIYVWWNDTTSSYAGTTIVW
jgi:hypothetical protein